ncbi:MAG: hypothetical protein KDJ50_02895 [Alphaproteobacteria bacterium]|nr:hypothetical protein [Alphaproteobacteria bacterium]
MTYHFITKAIAPVVLAITEALCPYAIGEVTELVLPEQAPIVQMAKNPHDNENASLCYEFYKKRLQDACTRVTVGSNNIMVATGEIATPLNLSKATYKPPDFYFQT